MKNRTQNPKLDAGGRKLGTIFKPGRTAFMPYVCCGDPTAEFTTGLVHTLIDAGADAIEFGIPFSDPIADGKSIQAASMRALRHGMTPAKALSVLRRIRRDGIEVPIILMTYYNIIIANGNRRFLREAKEAGADALIVPDVPLEESENLDEACAGAGLTLIRMVSVNCSDGRLKAAAKKAGGFLYAVGALGTTGARDCVDGGAMELVARMKRDVAVPVAVGFGISRPAHATLLCRAGADGIIVGSAIADIYSGAILQDGTVSSDLALAKVREFAKAMKAACVTRL